ncbi:MAG: replicative DNA helicase [Bacteroidetes bacterium]|nr:replicative DNA helicase [Bacteroidota bacterium]
MQSEAISSWGSILVENLQDSSGRVPPQAVEVEKYVLGATLIDPEAVSIATEILPADAFYLPKHRKIYQALLDLSAKGQPIDIITVTEQLRATKQLDFVGGISYLNDLTEHVATSANTEHHARIISQKALLRNLIGAMGKRITEAYDPATDAFELLDAAEKDLFSISESQVRRSAKNLKDVVRETIDHIQSIADRPGGLSGVTSGFTDLDKLTGGWQDSDLVIIAGRPSMGKTAFALSCARNAALASQNPVSCAIFSLEMSARQLTQRLLTSEAKVNAQNARTGKLSQNDLHAVVDAAGKLGLAPIFIDDSDGLGVLELRAKCRRLKSEHNIGLVLVDYLQLMEGQSRDNREQEIANISRSLKGLAKELDIPVIALSQLNRNAEDRKDRRPQLSDLRESGAIEQDADVVAFIYRASYYGIETDKDGHSTKGVAEIIVGKHRNGPTGTVKLNFETDFARFSNLEVYRRQEDYTPELEDWSV